MIKSSTLEQKAQDVETSYEELNKTIKITVGDKEENWSIAKYIQTYVKRLSNIDEYEKKLDKANKDITMV